MNYKVNLAALDNSFRVPDSLADNFIKLANPKHIIVLLWVLRHAKSPKSAEEISEELHLSKDIVSEAVFYWIDNGLMVPDSGRNDADETHPKVSAPAESKKQKATSEAKSAVIAAPIHKLGSSMASEEEILKRAKESPEFTFLLRRSQEIYGRTISKAERSMLLTLMDYYGLPPEVILMLINHAVASGRTATNYIQTVGISWAEDDIKTLEEAELRIKELDRVNILWNKFTQQAEIPHKHPTKKQEVLFAKWTGEWKFSVEIIAYGYERMLDSIDKVNYKYLDKILASWHENGAYTIEKIEQLDSSRKRAKDSAAAESFSTDKFDSFIDKMDLVYDKEDKQ